MLTRNGFDELPKFEAELEQEYRDFLNTKFDGVLTDCCEGFEILEPIYTKVCLDKICALFKGREPNAVATVYC